MLLALAVASLRTGSPHYCWCINRSSNHYQRASLTQLSCSLGYVQDGVSYTNERPAGNITQHIWRYTAATNKWASIYKETYTKIVAKGVSTRRKAGVLTPHLGSLAASSGSLLWAGWEGERLPALVK